MLTDDEKVNIRRFCGYPPYGSPPIGITSWRYFQIYGLLEFRLSYLSGSEILIVRRYLKTLVDIEADGFKTSNDYNTDLFLSSDKNDAESADKLRLIGEWRLRLCGFLGVTAGPLLS